MREMKCLFLLLIAFAFQLSLCENENSILFANFDHQNSWIREGTNWSGEYKKCSTSTDLGQFKVFYENLETGLEENENSLKTDFQKVYNLKLKLDDQKVQDVQDDLLIMVYR